MKKIIFVILIVAITVSSFPLAQAVSIATTFPGTNNATSSPGAFIANFYQFALLIGGILAFGVIVYGGIKYMTSTGNPSGQGDAKEWIEAALLGLLLLVGAYFLLTIINPNLVNLGLPALNPLQTTGGTGNGGTGCGSTICTGTTGN